MAQSLEKRLGDDSERAVRYTGKYGRGFTMRYFNIKDDIAFANFLESKTGDRNYGLSPSYGDPDGMEFRRKVRTQFAEMLLEIKTENVALKKENIELKRLLSIQRDEIHKDDREDLIELVEVMETCVE